MIRWLTLLRWCSAGYRWAMVRAGLGAMLGVAITIALLSLGESARTLIATELLGGGDRIRVKPPSFNLGPVDLAGSVLPARPMTHKDVVELQGVSGVSEVWPEAWSRFPVVLRGDALGVGMRTDAALLGVVAEGVRKDVRGEWSFTPGEPVPVLAPRSLLAVFNGSFAPANGLPRLRDSAIIGRTFTLAAGDSSFGRQLDHIERLEGEVVGVTAYGGSLAAIVPIEAVAWLDGQLGLPSPGRLSSAMVLIEPGESTADVRAAVAALGWAVEDVGGAARHLATAIDIIDRGVGLVGLILVAVTLLGLAQVYAVLLRQRAQDVVVLRSLGTPPGWLAGGMVAEVGLAALLATGLGLLSGWVLAMSMAGPAGDAIGELLGLSVVLSPGLPLFWTLILVLGAAPTAILGAAPAIYRTLADASA